MTSAPERGTEVSIGLTALASAGALVVVVMLVWACVRPSPARDVSFDGESDAEPTCHSIAYWTGREAFTACDWAYDERALVRFDPMQARATVLHAWARDDGNAPHLQIVTACPTGHLFVVRERHHTTVVRVDSDTTTATTLSDASDGVVLGASCRAEDAELFVQDGRRHAIFRFAEDAVAARSEVGVDEIEGEPIGAWFEDERWHAVVVRWIASDEFVLAVGPLGGRFETIKGSHQQRACPLGAPGGWTGPCVGHNAVFTRRGGRLGLEPLSSYALTMVYADRNAFGTTTKDEPMLRLRGLPDVELDLVDVDDEFFVHSSTTSASIGSSDFSTLDIGARALPLPDGGVAIWGGLGKKVVRLGPDLQREDTLGPLERVVRPYGRFRASTMSELDQFLWFTLLGCTAAFIGIVVASLRRRVSRRLRTRVAAGYLVALVLCARGFFEIIDWI